MSTFSVERINELHYSLELELNVKKINYVEKCLEENVAGSSSLADTIQCNFKLEHLAAL